MKSILMTTSAVLLVTGFAAGQAQAACPEDIDAFTRDYEATLQNTAAGEALSTAEQAQLFGLKTAAENLHQAGDAEMCAAVIERAKLILNSAIAPRVIQPDELVGREVVNSQDENLGEIEDVMIDPVSGRIAYVVVEHGGFLGIGDDLFAVPWSAMQFVPGNDQTVLLDIPEEKLENAPRFSRDDESPLERREWVTAVHSYYGVQPYWQDDIGTAVMQYGGGAGAAQAGDSAGETTTIVVPITESEGGNQSDTTQPDTTQSDTTQSDTGAQTEQTDQQTDQTGQQTGQQTESEPATESDSPTEQQPDPDSQSEAAQPSDAAGLAAAQPPADDSASGDQVETLISRLDQLEQQIQSLSEQVPGEDVTQAIARLEEQMQTVAEQQSSGDEVMQSISRLEEQVQQLSQQVPGEDIQQQIARIEEQLAGFANAGGAGGAGQSGGQGEPAAVVIVPDQSAQDSGQQAGQSQPAQEPAQQEAAQQPGQQQASEQQAGQQTEQQASAEETEQQQQAPEQTEQPQAAEETEQQPAGGQTEEQQADAAQGSGGAAEQGQQQEEVALQQPAEAAAGATPCQELLTQLEEDLQRAEQLGVAIDDAESEFKEAQAMLNNNSEALCRAAIKRAHEELVSVGFEPTETN